MNGWISPITNGCSSCVEAPVWPCRTLIGRLISVLEIISCFRPINVTEWSARITTLELSGWLCIGMPFKAAEARRLQNGSLTPL